MEPIIVVCVITGCISVYVGLSIICIKSCMSIQINKKENTANLPVSYNSFNK